VAEKNKTTSKKSAIKPSCGSLSPNLSVREMKAWRAYIVASRHLLDALDADLGEHGISLSDYEILSHLSESEDRRIRMSDLAQAAMVSRSRLSHRIKAMEKLGWVKKEICPTDKRGSFAVLTANGWKALSNAAPDHLLSVKSRFAEKLSAKDQDDVARIFQGLTNELRNDYLQENQ
jgi:DNA-binding MarR family transcriptional regulator